MSSCWLFFVFFTQGFPSHLLFLRAGKKKNNHTGTGFARVKHFLVPAKSEDNRLRERDATPMAAKLLKAKFKGQRKQKQVA